MKASLRGLSRQVFVAGCVAAFWLPGSIELCAAGEQIPLQARLRILSHNVFGRESDFCEDRARGFGHIVANANPPFDIVGVEEFYHNPDFDIATCDSGYLAGAIHCTRRCDNYYEFYPHSGPLGAFDGGIGIYTIGSICQFEAYRWNYQDFGAVQGAIFARVEIPNTTVTLDVYVIHLHGFVDSCDRCCRKQQLEELAVIIQSRSSRSGNPVFVMGDFNIGGPPNCCGNEGYDDIMEILGSPRDIWWEKNHCDESPSNCGAQFPECDAPQVPDCTVPPLCAGHPPPELESCIDETPLVCAPPNCSIFSADVCTSWAGATNNSCLNELGDANERIDFIFLLTDPALTSSAFSIQTAEARVANWTVLHQDPPDCFGCPYPDCFIPDECNSAECASKNDCLCATCACFECEPKFPDPYPIHVSDHLGVEATIDVLGMSSVWADPHQPTQGSGTSCDPFASIEDATAAVPPGNRVLLRTGLFPERIRIDRPMRLQSVGGAVVVGF